MRFWRRVRCRINERWKIRRMSQLQPLFPLDLSVRIRQIQKVHGGGPLTDGVMHIGDCLYLNQLDSRSANLMVPWTAMCFLDDDLRLESSEVWNLFDIGLIASGQNSGITILNGGRSSGSDQRTIALRQLEHFSNAFPDRGFQVVNVDEVQRGQLHDRFRIRPHQRSSKVGRSEERRV